MFQNRSTAYLESNACNSACHKTNIFFPQLLTTLYLHQQNMVSCFRTCLWRLNINRSLKPLILTLSRNYYGVITILTLNLRSSIELPVHKETNELSSSLYWSLFIRFLVILLAKIEIVYNFFWPKILMFFCLHKIIKKTLRR